MCVSDKNQRDFKKAVNRLNSVIAVCRKDLPGCFAYLDGNHTMHLLDGTQNIGDERDQETIIVSATLDAAGGDW